MGKAADCYFKLAEGGVWDLNQEYEPLLIFCCFPFLPHRPSLEERQRLGRRVLWTMSAERMQEEPDADHRPLLRQLFCQAWSLRSL